MKREIRFREIRAGYIFLYIFWGGGEDIWLVKGRNKERDVQSSFQVFTRNFFPLNERA